MRKERELVEDALRIAAEIKALGYTPLPAYDGSMRVLLKLDPDSDTYDEGGLIIKPEQHKTQPITGTIVAVAPVHEEDRPKFAVEAGMRVMIQRYDAKLVGLRLRGGMEELCLQHVGDLYVTWPPDMKGDRYDDDSDGGAGD